MDEEQQKSSAIGEAREVGAGQGEDEARVTVAQVIATAIRAEYEADTGPGLAVLSDREQVEWRQL